MYNILYTKKIQKIDDLNQKSKIKRSRSLLGSSANLQNHNLGVMLNRIRSSHLRSGLSSFIRHGEIGKCLRFNSTSRSIFSELEPVTKPTTNQGNGELSLADRVTSLQATEDGADAANEKKPVSVSDDKPLLEYIAKKQGIVSKPATEQYLSPLKRQLYELNCEINGGFYKKDTILKLPNSKTQYKLNLTRDEIETLEPSVYLKSYRIKSSLKKATVFLRLLRGMDLNRAITQCHFARKKIAYNVAELLQRGVEDAQTLGLKPQDLFISQIWVGSDGQWNKRVDIKARTRFGIIRHPFVHVRCILKSKSVTLKRLEYEAQEKQRRAKPWVQLADEPIRGVTGNVYKW